MSDTGKIEEKNGKQDDSNDSKGKKQVNIRVGYQKKDKWHSFVAQSDYAHLSHFLRQAAEKEISRQEASNDGDEYAHLQGDKSQEILNELDAITTSLQSMDRRLSAIEADRYGDEELSELVTQVYQNLPTSINEIQQEQRKKLEGEPANTGSIEDLSQRLDADKASVEMAVQRLRNTTHSVLKTQNATEDETVFYYLDE